jgi:hypothetical protein
MQSIVTLRTMTPSIITPSTRKHTHIVFAILNLMLFSIMTLSIVRHHLKTLRLLNIMTHITSTYEMAFIAMTQIKTTLSIMTNNALTNRKKTPHHNDIQHNNT